METLKSATNEMIPRETSDSKVETLASTPERSTKRGIDNNKGCKIGDHPAPDTSTPDSAGELSLARPPGRRATTQPVNGPFRCEQDEQAFFFIDHHLSLRVDRERPRFCTANLDNSFSSRTSSPFPRQRVPTREVLRLQALDSQLIM